MKLISFVRVFYDQKYIKIIQKFATFASFSTINMF